MWRIQWSLYLEEALSLRQESSLWQQDKLIMTQVDDRALQAFMDEFEEFSIKLDAFQFSWGICRGSPSSVVLSILFADKESVGHFLSNQAIKLLEKEDERLQISSIIYYVGLINTAEGKQQNVKGLL
eukprot:TRINITY_DN9745_c0_g1_i1.p4 TRINITY_DN9745_c0_g1~~TRINITY_DN9745_c0_g1_i1.p4  ORF type:complete len:127 (+),score=11.01 TRINITY_DN9745_c0_g1_i1:433-813(+)